MKVNVIKSKEETLSLDEALNVRGGLSQASDGSEVECGCDCWIGKQQYGYYKSDEADKSNCKQRLNNVVLSIYGHSSPIDRFFRK